MLFTTSTDTTRTITNQQDHHPLSEPVLSNPPYHWSPHRRRRRRLRRRLRRRRRRHHQPFPGPTNNAYTFSAKPKHNRSFSSSSNTMPHVQTNIHRSPIMVCGFSTTFILFAVGLSCLVVACLEYVNATSWRSAVDCGLNGKPPLLEWVFGTGIAYLIMAFAYANVTRQGSKAGRCTKCVLLLSNTFLFAWMIVGAVSLWRDGTNCETLNLTLWRMGYAAVIISIVLVCRGGYASYESVTVVNDGM